MILPLHVILIFGGIAACIAAFVMSALVFFENRLIKNKRGNKLLIYLPALEYLDRWVFRLIAVGFSLMTAALILGLWLAHERWQSGWARDPKIIITMLCWLWYAALLLMRSVLGWRGSRLAIMNFVGFAVLLLLFGADFYLKTNLHHFLFSLGGGS